MALSMPPSSRAKPSLFTLISGLHRIAASSIVHQRVIAGLNYQEHSRNRSIKYADKIKSHAPGNPKTFTTERLAIWQIFRGFSSSRSTFHAHHMSPSSASHPRGTTKSHRSRHHPSSSSTTAQSDESPFCSPPSWPLHPARSSPSRRRSPSAPLSSGCSR
jgi:hypothetical protein